MGFVRSDQSDVKNGWNPLYGFIILFAFFPHATFPHPAFIYQYVRVFKLFHYRSFDKLL